MNHIELTDGHIDTENILNLVTSESCGAVSVFIGTTRNDFQGRAVTRLEYEAYRPMAKSEINKICSDIRDRWPAVEHIGIVHRLGLVPLKEASIVIAISSPHRRDAMDATNYAIDTLKGTVPIWKKEFYEDGGCSWKENSECVWSSKNQTKPDLTANPEPNAPL